MGQEAAAIGALIGRQLVSGRELCALFDAMDHSRSRDEHLQRAGIAAAAAPAQQSLVSIPRRVGIVWYCRIPPARR